MDEVPVNDIRRFERELLEYLHRKEQGLMTSIKEGAKMSDDTLQALGDAIAELEKEPFETSDRESSRRGRFGRRQVT
ncbi:ATP synthase subunit alpha OS=Streptomyces alboniger OX=132473 GN=atpA PE=3 SV=1 [Streptomyces alboniger]